MVGSGADAARPPGERAIKVVDAGLLLLVTLVLLLRLRLIFLLNINWDEFLFLAHVHRHLRGELTGPFQMLHVHLFSWLPLVSGNEVSQIMAARAVMFGLSAGSCALTYLIGRQFLGRTGALFAVLAYASLSNLVEHGSSFRADPMGAFLFLASIWLLLCRTTSWRAAAGAGTLMALSMMLSIKAAIHLASISVLFLALLISANDRRATLVRMASFGGSLLAAFGLLYALHVMSLAPQVSADAAGSIVATANKVFLAHGFFPRWLNLRNSLFRNPFVWGIMLTGAVILAINLTRRREDSSRQALIFGSFLVPLLSVLVYRNAFPYFYVFVLAPAILAAGVLAHDLAGLVKSKGSRWAAAELVAFGAFVFANFVVHYQANAVDGTIAQRQIIETVHRAFPEPVPYIDGPSMIASYPQVGFFMSKWGIENYREAGHPVLAEAIARDGPVFLLANNDTLFDAMAGTQVAAAGYALLEEDRSALKQNYIQHWGVLFVAGKSLELPDATPWTFEILVPGHYTLESAGPAVIDGVAVDPLGSIHLDRGRHVIRVSGGPARVTLRWGKGLFRPTEPPTDQLIFAPFR